VDLYTHCSYITACILLFSLLLAHQCVDNDGVSAERRRWHSGKALLMEMQSYDGSDQQHSAAVAWTLSQSCGLSTPPPHLTSAGQHHRVWISVEYL